MSEVRRIIEDRLGPLRESFVTDPRAGTWPLFLPRHEDTEVTCWYAIVPDAEDLHDLSRQLVAFVGPTYSAFDGRVRRLDLSDATEASVADVSPHVIVLPVPEPRAEYGPRIEERIGWLRDLRVSQPTLPGTGGPLIGELVRDLEESLRLQDVSGAERLIALLKEQESLDPRNFSFLDILVLELTEQWDELLAAAHLHRVLTYRRPARVTRALLRAIHAKHIDSCVVSDDPTEALFHFQMAVWPNYSQLFSSRVGLSGKAVRSLFMLKACFSGQADVAEELLGEAGEDRSWLQSLANLTIAREIDPEEQDGFAEAWRWYRQGDLDRAWRLALDGTAGLEKTDLVVLCARDSGSVAWADAALQEFQSLSDALGGDLAPPPRLEKAVEDLLQTLRAHVAGWQSWADALTQPERWPGAISVAEAGADEWGVGDLATEDGAAERFAIALASVSRDNTSILQQSIPHILRALESLPSDVPGADRLFETLATLVLVDDAPGQNFFLTLSDVLERILGNRVATNTYTDLLADLRTAIEQHGSATQFTALLELLHTLVVSRAPDPNARLSVYTAILGRATRDQRHLQPFQISLLQRLAQDLGKRIPDALVERTQVVRSASDQQAAWDDWSVYDGHTIALYSLNESALQRAATEIRRLVENVDVRTYSAHRGSDSLRDAARNADFFVVAPRAAKHAATEFISRHRPPGSKPIYAPGKGAASLVAALFTHLPSLGVNTG